MLCWQFLEIHALEYNSFSSYHAQLDNSNWPLYSDSKYARRAYSSSEFVDNELASKAKNALDLVSSCGTDIKKVPMESI